MKIIWTKALVQEWFDMLTEYTGAEFRYPIVMDERMLGAFVDEKQQALRIPVRLYNHVDVPDDYILLRLTYIFGFFSDLHLPMYQRVLAESEAVIQDICEHFDILFMPKSELDVQQLKIERMLLSDSKSSRYQVGDRLIKKFSVLTYTVTEIGPLIDNKREITISSERETLVLDEEELVRNYYFLAKPPAE